MTRILPPRRLIEAAVRLTDHSLGRLAAHPVSPGDSQSNIGCRDVSAKALAASAPFELAGLLDDPALCERYRLAGGRMLAALCSPPYFAAGDTHCLLDHSVQYLPFISDVDVPAILADHHFLVAIVRHARAGAEAT